MKSFSGILGVVLLSVLLGPWVHAAEAAGAGNGKAHQRGGEASERMSDKGKLNNNNSQWSADPERGWVRAEERHKVHDETRGTTDWIKKDNGKAKGKRKNSNS